MPEFIYPTAFSHWTEDEQVAIDRVLKSGRLTMGPEVAAFEEEFAEFHKVKHGIMVNSGSSANLIAVAAASEKLADRALDPRAWVPAIAWSTTYAPLRQYGFSLRLLDCDATWNATPDQIDLERQASPHIIVACSVLGNPANLWAWRKLADQGGAYMIEDNCESVGASLAVDIRHPLDKRRLCGTFGHLNTFSFFYSHQLSAVEGGMILTDDDELAKLCRMLRAHGWTRDVTPPKSFDDEYDFRYFGYNVRPVEMHAAVAREQLQKLEGFRLQRQQNFNNFVIWAHGLPLEYQKPVNGAWPNPFGIAFCLKDKETRTKVVEALRSHRIDCRLPTGGSFRKHRYGEPWSNQQTPNADRIHDTGLFLGNAPFPIDHELKTAAKVIRQALA